MKQYLCLIVLLLLILGTDSRKNLKKYKSIKHSKTVKKYGILKEMIDDLLDRKRDEYIDDESSTEVFNNISNDNNTIASYNVSCNNITDITVPDAVLNATDNSTDLFAYFDKIGVAIDDIISCNYTALSPNYTIQYNASYDDLFQYEKEVEDNIVNEIENEIEGSFSSSDSSSDDYEDFSADSLNGTSSQSDFNDSFDYDNTTVDYDNTTADYDNTTANYDNTTANYDNTTADSESTTALSVQPSFMGLTRKNQIFVFAGIGAIIGIAFVTIFAVVYKRRKVHRNTTVETKSDEPSDQIEDLENPTSTKAKSNVEEPTVESK